MDKTLEEKIEERKKQAQERRIHIKALAIARYMGGAKPLPRYIQEGNSSAYEFSGGDQDIEVIFCYPSVYNGNSVFESDLNLNDERITSSQVKVKYQSKYCFRGYISNRGQEITGYIPGAWENTLDAFYAEAQKVAMDRDAEKQANYKKAQQEKEDQLKKAFGL